MSGTREQQQYYHQEQWRGQQQHVHTPLSLSLFLFLFFVPRRAYVEVLQGVLRGDGPVKVPAGALRAHPWLEPQPPAPENPQVRVLLCGFWSWFVHVVLRRIFCVFTVCIFRMK